VLIFFCTFYYYAFLSFYFLQLIIIYLFICTFVHLIIICLCTFVQLIIVPISSYVLLYHLLLYLLVLMYFCTSYYCTLWCLCTFVHLIIVPYGAYVLLYISVGCVSTVTNPKNSLDFGSFLLSFWTCPIWPIYFRSTGLYCINIWYHRWGYLLIPSHCFIRGFGPWPWEQNTCFVLHHFRNLQSLQIGDSRGQLNGSFMDLPRWTLAEGYPYMVVQEPYPRSFTTSSTSAPQIMMTCWKLPE